MAYTDEQLLQFGRTVGDLIRGLRSDIDALKEAPQTEKANNSWQEGRRFARSRGYGDADLERLENFMVGRGIANHGDAMKLDPVGGLTSQFWGIGGIPKDEMDALMSGDFDLAERLGVTRALSGEDE